MHELHNFTSCKPLKCKVHKNMNILEKGAPHNSLARKPP